MNRLAIVDVWTAVPEAGDLLPPMGSAHGLLAVLGLAALTAGGLGALLSTRPTGLAAWLAVVQGGFALLGLSMGGAAGPGIALLVLASVAAAVLAIGLLARRAGSLRALPPLPSSLLGLFLLSLAGVPPTAGFAARFRALETLVAAGFPVLALLAVGLSLLSLAAVVRMLVASPDVGEAEAAPGPLAVGVALVLAAAVVGAGVFPP